MKKALIGLTALILCLYGIGQLAAQNNAEDAKFKKFMDSYWDAHFKFFPTEGTLAGYTKYNDKLEDLSNGAIEKFHDGLDAANQELVAKIDRMKLSPEALIEYEMMIDAIDQEFVRFESLVPWEYNSIFYNTIFLNSLRSLLVGNSTPLEARVKSATERAKQLPNLIKKAKENLKTPPQIYTELAIRQMPDIINFYKTEVPSLAGAAAGSAALLAETAKVVAALEDYRNFLSGELLARSTGNFRIGPEAHPRLLRDRSQGVLPIMEEIVARSRADVNNIRREMALVCIPFYKIMYPELNIEQAGAGKGDEAARNAIINGVLDKIKGDHPSKEEFVAKIGSAAERIKDFIQKNDLLNIPQEPLVVEPMPPAMRGSLWSFLAGPGAYETSGAYKYYIQPIPDDWPVDMVTQFLEEHNNYFIDFLTVQKVLPGIFVPTAFLNMDPSPVKKLLANQALIKGWPIYFEEIPIFAGYGNFDLRMRLNQLKLQLKNAIDFQMDINIHQGTFTEERAVSYMTEWGFMTAAEAKRRWNELVLNPGDAALAYIGYQEILDMEKDYKKLKGSEFSKKEFLQKLLSYGPIPLRVLKTKMAQ